jgi:hypothetical protein
MSHEEQMAALDALVASIETENERREAQITAKKSTRGTRHALLGTHGVRALCRAQAAVGLQRGP